MAGEEWARRVIMKELQRLVELNDDGSRPSMYDLRIGPANAPDVAIECVGAVDPVFTETWNVGPARGVLQLSINGNWIVEIEASARVKGIRSQLEAILAELELRGINRFRIDFHSERTDRVLFVRLKSLGITDVSRYELGGTGKVYLSMQGRGGAVDEKGSSVPTWVVSFLRDPSRKDVATKLLHSGSPNRHVFVIVSFFGVPWEVESYLTGSLDHLPTQCPNLPPEVTEVWIAAPSVAKGVRWDGQMWRSFETRGRGIDESR